MWCANRGRLRACILSCVFVTLGSQAVLAQVSVSGEWRKVGHEFPEPGSPELGDYTALPLKPGVVLGGQSWTESRWTLPERHCGVYQTGVAYHAPAPALRFWEEQDAVTRDPVAIHAFISTYARSRTIWLDDRPRPSPRALHTWEGFSKGTWNGNILTVVTTHIKQSWNRRNGIRSSDKVTVTEQFIRHGNYLTYVSVTEDPVYLTEPLVFSQNFMLTTDVQPDVWQSHLTCQPDVEIAGRERGYVPHHLPGTNPYLTEYATKNGIPQEAVQGGAETMYPEYRARLKRLLETEAAESRAAASR